MRPAQGEHYWSVPTRVKIPAATESFKTFLAIKKNGDERGLVADARRRVKDR